ncbi:hypothetical protein FHS59_003175 [Algoriphagus iocasae]|jgi:hypothetical protein|uniref:Uncharacterized protein n=1 Tax=Algoriphagus iocasae TaxID=1836499 RepID=A0A841MH41_9BACT|nr:hypothetical protein [Algoriphagus iocasae]MBB6327532.1 hypothetical protein [Algoriphagus iocasae]
MKSVKTIIRNSLLVGCIFLTASCFGKNTKSETILIGSTPGDDLIKTMLAIPNQTKVDFIRWNLILDNENVFTLDITYGESKPNTLDFISAEKQTFNGTYSIVNNREKNGFKEIYQLKSDGLPGIISMTQISENLFHILTPQNKLMNGNGGWSYSLNRKVAVDSGEILISSPIPDDKSLQQVFDGRTPCQEIAAGHPEMKVSITCFKLKWKLTLNRDSVTHLPTTCTIRTVVDNQPRDVSGTWAIIKGTATNPEAIIYKIHANDLAEPISLLLGDENVLFFLDQDNIPLIGNEDFSFTMNKRVQ